MHEKDNQIDSILEQTPKLEPRQYDLTSQLYYLSRLAIKCGLYDADDYIKTSLYPKKKNI